MKVLVDTCVWSKVLRRKTPDTDLAVLIEALVREGRVVLIGPIRQELLSGVPNSVQFETLRKAFDPFEDISLRAEHFIRAAEFSNQCRRKGVQGSTIDFLICAVAAIEGLQILTTDSDFLRYAKHLPIHLCGVSG
jgi:predicted nucleic acid-binding protein